MSTGIVTRFKEAGQSAMAAHRPWSEFSDLSALSLPRNLSDATTRLFQNSTHFRSNYAMLVLVVLFLSLLYHPVSLIVFLLVFAAWVFFYFSRDDDVSVFGFFVGDRVVMAVLGVVTVVALVLTHVWLNVVVSGVVGAVVVCVHAVFRGTEDLVMEDEESPYGALLSDDPDPRGNYTIM
ncbi:hypothetical protein ACLB2K_038550 [Fragaria x ananassa]